jgi:hypothetical protein
MVGHGVLKGHKEKYNLKKNQISVMKLANFGLPLTRGKTPSKTTQKRKGSASKESVEVNDYQDDTAIQTQSTFK